MSSNRSVTSCSRNAFRGNEVLTGRLKASVKQFATYISSRLSNYNIISKLIIISAMQQGHGSRLINRKGHMWSLCI
jgi:hypothetical protein